MVLIIGIMKPEFPFHSLFFVLFIEVRVIPEVTSEYTSKAQVILKQVTCVCCFLGEDVPKFVSDSSTTITVELTLTIVKNT